MLLLPHCDPSCHCCSSLVYVVHAMTPLLFVCLQTVEYKLLASLNILNVAQSLIIFSGLAAGLTVCAKVGVLSD